MQILYTLTEDEYNDLLKVQTKPDTILRDTNSALKKKLDDCQLQLQQGAFDNSRVDTPFIVTDDVLHFRSPTDFILMWNALAKPTPGDSDQAMLKYLSNLTSIFNYDPQFSTLLQVKRYRVNLQKKSITSKSIKRNGMCYLPTKD